MKNLKSSVNRIGAIISGRFKFQARILIAAVVMILIFYVFFSDYVVHHFSLKNFYMHEVVEEDNPYNNRDEYFSQLKCEVLASGHSLILRRGPSGISLYHLDGEGAILWRHNFHSNSGSFDFVISREQIHLFYQSDDLCYKTTLSLEGEIMQEETFEFSSLESFTVLEKDDSFFLYGLNNDGDTSSLDVYKYQSNRDLSNEFSYSFPEKYDCRINHDRTLTIYNVWSSLREFSAFYYHPDSGLQKIVCDYNFPRSYLMGIMKDGNDILVVTGAGFLVFRSEELYRSYERVRLYDYFNADCIGFQNGHIISVNELPEWRNENSKMNQIQIEVIYYEVDETYEGIYESPVYSLGYPDSIHYLFLNDRYYVYTNPSIYSNIWRSGNETLAYFVTDQQANVAGKPFFENFFSFRKFLLFRGRTLHNLFYRVLISIAFIICAFLIYMFLFTKFFPKAVKSLSVPESFVELPEKCPQCSTEIISDDQQCNNCGWPYKGDMQL